MTLSPVSSKDMQNLSELTASSFLCNHRRMLIVVQPETPVKHLYDRVLLQTFEIGEDPYIVSIPMDGKSYNVSDLPTTGIEKLFHQQKTYVMLPHLPASVMYDIAYNLARTIQSAKNLDKDLRQVRNDVATMFMEEVVSAEKFLAPIELFRENPHPNSSEGARMEGWFHEESERLLVFGRVAAKDRTMLRRVAARNLQVEKDQIRDVLFDIKKSIQYNKQQSQTPGIYYTGLVGGYPDLSWVRDISPGKYIKIFDDHKKVITSSHDTHLKNLMQRVFPWSIQNLTELLVEYVEIGHLWKNPSITLTNKLLKLQEKAAELDQQATAIV